MVGRVAATHLLVGSIPTEDFYSRINQGKIVFEKGIVL